MIKDVIWNQLIRWSNFFYSYWESNPYLEAKYVLLCPPSLNDFDGLSSSAPDGEIWSNPYALFPSKHNRNATIFARFSGSNNGHYALTPPNQIIMAVSFELQTQMIIWWLCPKSKSFASHIGSCSKFCYSNRLWNGALECKGINDRGCLFWA